MDILNRNDTDDMNYHSSDLNNLDVTGILFSLLNATDTQYKTENLFLQTSEIEKLKNKGQTRLERSLKKHVEQYETNIIRFDNDQYVSKDRDLINNGKKVRHKTPNNYIINSQSKIRTRPDNNSRRCIKTASENNRDLVKSYSKDARVQTSNGVRSKPQFNHIQSDLINDKRCRTAAYNHRLRVKSDIVINQQPEPSVNMVMDYNSTPKNTTMIHTNIHSAQNSTMKSPRTRPSTVTQ